MSSKYKELNQINNIVGKVLEENEELNLKLLTYQNAAVKNVDTETGREYSPLIDYVGRLLAKEVDDIYISYNFDVEYGEEGISKTLDQVYEYQFEKWYAENKMYLHIAYQTALDFIKPHYKSYYDKRVNDLKMEYVRNHKENS